MCPYRPLMSMLGLIQSKRERHWRGFTSLLPRRETPRKDFGKRTKTFCRGSRISRNENFM